jgi:hypothetical protein
MDANQGGPAAYFLVFKDGEAVDPAEAPRDGMAFREGTVSHQGKTSTN